MTRDDSLLKALDRLTRDHPQGITEFALINQLDRDPGLPFCKPDMSDHWALFQVHFWLFHHLYLLKLGLQDQGETLYIVATGIRRFPLSAPGRVNHQSATTMADTDPAAVGFMDPMQRYYLDLDNLFQETPDGVASKLDAFWQRLTDPHQHHQDWQTLELEPPVSANVLRQQYRRLCQRHHPDRGGSADQFRAVQAAYARLKR